MKTCLLDDKLGISRLKQRQGLEEAVNLCGSNTGQRRMELIKLLLIKKDLLDQPHFKLNLVCSSKRQYYSLSFCVILSNSSHIITP